MPYAAGFAPALQRSVTPQCVSNSAGSYAAVAGRQRGAVFQYSVSEMVSYSFASPLCRVLLKQSAAPVFCFSKTPKASASSRGAALVAAVYRLKISAYGRPSVASREATACSAGPIREGRHKGVLETPAVPCAMYLVAMCFSSSWRQVSRRGIL